jgi:hypothetical protein
LKAFLEAFNSAGGERKSEVLRAALIGGMGDGQAEAGQAEDSETSVLLDGLLAEF